MSTNPFTRPLRETMNDPQFDWVRRQGVRRQFVICFVALIIALPLALWFIESIFVIVAALVPFVFVMGSLNASVRGLTELRARDLDEREIAFRGRIYSMLYWPGVYAATASGVAMGTLSAKGSLFVAGSGLSLFFLALALPTLWLAWTLPEEPAAE